VLSAGRGRPAGTPFGLLVPALPHVPWTECGASGVWLVGPRICWRVGGTRDIPLKALFPQGRERFELGSAGWSPVLGSDAVGGPPHCNVADEGGAQVVSRWCPDWLCVTLAGVVLELVGEVGDKLGSLCQVVAPDRIGMERCWNARKPGKRASVDRRQRCETPVEDGAHIVCGAKVASGGGRQQVTEWMLAGLGRQGGPLCGKSFGGTDFDGDALAV
jgi:hypothetical protein